MDEAFRFLQAESFFFFFFLSEKFKMLLPSVYNWTKTEAL